MARTDPARLVAFEVLRAVSDQDAYANLELSRLLRERGVSGRDAALATELVGGTLRLQGSYDDILDRLVKGTLQPPVRDALRLGTHQLLSMRVPTHAAVTTTVDLVKEQIGHKPSGLVNAVLRKVAAQDLESWLTDRPRPARTAHPAWVIDALAEALDRPAELDALLAADNERPAVVLVARPGLADVAELGGSALAASPYAVELEGGDPGAVPAVREGRAGVQDAGSQLVALVLARAALEGDDQRWLDVCAGPGGKAALLAAIAAERGAGVLANERQRHRAQLVAQGVRAARAGVLGVVTGDGTRPPWSPGTFDRVLVDAPCSGLGALRRRPESRWRRTAADVEELVPLQVALLDAALDAARPGGVVLYATCSPVVAETAGVVRTVLERRTDAVVEPALDLIGDLEDAESAHLPGALQLWPHRHRTDAMFLSLLRRR
ncbi:RsmB/NOP family class I SAM-dependent RNA methyltransferase [Nocardioides marmoriginsengisoli]|uniref:RsmB/NOP family class I SAM-dependent RNA methyltransferase n=1 Tax=Nocardioides marmoriginsengisoli TaxID=661483 RepID=UPI001FE43A31|nr:transcription antitermination factor NusB [Nocardioides marmoriginsengisoli]